MINEIINPKQRNVDCQTTCVALGVAILRHKVEHVCDVIGSDLIPIKHAYLHTSNRQHTLFICQCVFSSPWKRNWQNSPRISSKPLLKNLDASNKQMQLIPQYCSQIALLVVLLVKTSDGPKLSASNSRKLIVISKCIYKFLCLQL